MGLRRMKQIRIFLNYTGILLISFHHNSSSDTNPRIFVSIYTVKPKHSSLSSKQLSLWSKQSSLPSKQLSLSIQVLGKNFQIESAKTVKFINNNLPNLIFDLLLER
jgi:hypothetical protein